MKCVDDRACVDIVYIDMSKAFDSISHIKVVHKLLACKINTNVCDWIEQFLSNRLQRVIVNNDWYISGYSVLVVCLKAVS